MDTLPNIYFARMDVAPEGLLAFMNWYDSKHAPDVISVGFHSAHGYHSRFGKPFILNVYEIDSSEIFYSDAYNTMRSPESDPERPAILTHVTNRSNTVYGQVHTVGVAIPDRPWSDGSRVGAVTAPAVTSVRFDPVDDSAENGIEAWFRDAEFPGLAAQPGFVSARLLRRDGRPHHANPWVGTWATLVEWKDQSSAEAAEAEGGGTLERIAGSGLAIEKVAFNLAVRVTSISTTGSE